MWDWVTGMYWHKKPMELCRYTLLVLLLMLISQIRSYVIFYLPWITPCILWLLMATIVCDLWFPLQHIEIRLFTVNKKNMDKLRINNFSWTPQRNYLSKQANTLKRILLKNKAYQTRILYLLIQFFKSTGEIKMFSYKHWGNLFPVVFPCKKC